MSHTTRCTYYIVYAARPRGGCLADNESIYYYSSPCAQESPLARLDPLPPSRDPSSTKSFKRHGTSPYYTYIRNVVVVLAIPIADNTYYVLRYTRYTTVRGTPAKRSPTVSIRPWCRSSRRVYLRFEGKNRRITKPPKTAVRRELSIIPGVAKMTQDA